MVAQTVPSQSAEESGPVLALCGVEARLTAVLARRGAVLAALSLDAPGRHNEVLAPAVERLMRLADVAPADLSGVACVRGPGSFTGVRMTLAFSLGLARAASLPLAGLDYLPILAEACAPLLDGTLAVLTRARRGQVYVQPFAAPGGRPLAAPRAAALKALPGLLAGLPAPLRLAGGGATENRAELAGLLPGVQVLDAAWDHPLPAVLARLACAAAYSSAPIEPLYLRASDAEDNLEAIAAAKGLDPAEARRRLDEATGQTAG
ncbi:MAG: tRNA (adenosine(37)-N6)-threonylcarbamoyltransferase complex dimerization subunit type 1 TsaB [Thermodesulfobacteriota bacterium]